MAPAHAPSFVPDGPGIDRIDIPLGERVNSLYLISGREAAVLFDTGVDGTIPAFVLPAMAVAGLDPAMVRWVVVSHADVDHFGGVADAHEQLPDATVVAGAGDADLIEDYAAFEAARVRGFRRPWGVDESPDGIAWCRAAAREGRVDHRAHGGEVLDLGGRAVEVLALPGHSHGHLGLLDHRTGEWFISDAILGAAVPLADGSPAFPPTYRFLESYRATISRVAGATPPAVHTAHYGCYRGHHVEAFLRESRSFPADLDAVLDELITDTPMTLAVLLPEVNRRIATWPLVGTEVALAFPVVAHLEQRLADGRIELTATDDGALITRTPSRP